MCAKYEELNDLENLVMAQANNLEALIQSSTGKGSIGEKRKFSCKTREYSAEKKAAIRERVVKGRQAKTKAKARQSAETKRKKAKEALDKKPIQDEQSMPRNDLSVTQTPLA
jgi:hypothetical protein